MSISVKGTATQRDYNRQLEQVYLDKLYDITQPTVEFKASYKMMAELTEVPANIVSNVMQMLDKAGVLKRRFEYHSNAKKIGGNNDGGGRTAYWTLLTSKEHAENLLNKYQANLGHKRNGAEITPQIAQDWVNKSDAISQAKAWVDKTRGYMKASDLITSNLEALKAAGITVDEEAYLKAINVSHDERLSCIALVMPYIENLEKRKRSA